MIQFTIREVELRCNDLDAFTQLYVCRKAIPIFVGFADPDPIKVFNALSEMPEEEFQPLLQKILPFIQRQHNGEWLPIYRSGALVLWQDLTFDAIDLLKIFFKVLMEYLPPFFSGLKDIAE